ncbi:hypothetical protein AKO1_015290 [Acrasis kona]|uniref:Uncharacterized protein n=1 Tax=Acrasis kona TaxID=1008807 RepID=A0AAW2ZGX8_9EUKA
MNLLSLKEQVLYCVPGKIKKVGQSYNLEKAVVITDKGAYYAYYKSDVVEYIQGTEGLDLKEGLCSFNHTVLLATNGALYYFGENSMMQLGVSSEEVNSITRYDDEFFDGELVSQVAIGAYHTLVLTENNKLFLAGFDYFGARRLDKRKYIMLTSSYCSLLNDCKIEMIKSGVCHFAILTSEGHVLTSGSNAFGQLGHTHGGSGYTTLDQINSSNGTPLLVKDVACGSYCTIVLDQHNNLIYYGHQGGSPLSIKLDCMVLELSEDDVGYDVKKKDIIVKTKNSILRFEVERALKNPEVVQPHNLLYCHHRDLSTSQSFIYVNRSAADYFYFTNLKSMVGSDNLFDISIII